MSRVNGGIRANRSGRTFEAVVENLLIEKDFFFVEAARYFEYLATSPQHRVYTKQILLPGSISIFGDQLKHDFVCYAPEWEVADLIIEVKWQCSKGSVYEKFPYLVANIKQHPFPTMIILDGGGYKPAAEEWLRLHANVKNTCELIAWANECCP